MGGTIGKRQGLAEVSKESGSSSLPLPQPPGLNFMRGMPLKDRANLSEFNILGLASNITNRFSVLSGLSFISMVSVPQVENSRRPWSRVSRKRWHPKTLQNEYAQCKAVWPVAQTEALFLPEFPVGVEDKFKLVFLGEINRGAFGQVFHVRCASTHKEYAMKVLSKSQVCSLDAVVQVKQEVMIQHVCSHHPFITSLTHFWQTRKLLIVMTEYVGYGELQQLWRSLGRLPENLLTIYIAEIALALDFLHNAGIIYRDLKMENILLDVDGHIKLIDFGLSKWLSYGGRTKTICGTLQFMAPEILKGEDYSHSVDWWSLGIIAYCLLVGHYPVSGYDDHVSMGAAVEKFDYLPPARASKAVKSVLQGLLDRNPATRINALHSLQKEELFMNIDLDDVRDKKVSPRSILEEFIEGKSRPNFDDFAGLTSTPKKSVSSMGVSSGGDFSRAQSSHLPRRNVLWDRSRRSSSSPLLSSPLMHPGRLGHHDSLIKSISGYNGAAVPLLQSPLLRLARGCQGSRGQLRGRGNGKPQHQRSVSASTLPTAVSPLLVNVRGNQRNQWKDRDNGDSSSEAMDTVSGMNGLFKKGPNDESKVAESKIVQPHLRLKRSKTVLSSQQLAGATKPPEKSVAPPMVPSDTFLENVNLKDEFFSGLVTSTPKHQSGASETDELLTKCTMVNGALLGNNKCSPLSENDFDDTLEHFPWISESFDT